MTSIDGTDVHEDIAKLIRTNYMSKRLVEVLIRVTTQAAYRELNAYEVDPPAHLAFEIMSHSAYKAAKNTLAEAVQHGNRFHNYLNAFVADFDHWLDHNAREATMTALNHMRGKYTAHYGFPVITPEAIEWIAQRLGYAEVLEVGAGNAYLAYRLAQAGVNVIPTDAHSLDDNPYQLGRTYHTSVIQVDALSAITELNDLNLLWSWPPPDDESGQALKQFTGQYFLYIGEPCNGCTGGEMFQELLESSFDYVDGMSIPTFPGISDSIALYRRLA